MGTNDRYEEKLNKELISGFTLYLGMYQNIYKVSLLHIKYFAWAIETVVVTLVPASFIEETLPHIIKAEHTNQCFDKKTFS